MGFFRSTPEERAAGQAEFQAEMAERSRANQAPIAAADAERAAAWSELGAPAGIVVDRVYASDSTEDAFAAFAQYAGAIGLRPEDTYGLQVESGDSYDYVPRAMIVVYRDTPEYAARRRAFHDDHPERTPHHVVMGVPSQADPPAFAPGDVRGRIGASR